ncbi:MAG: winged helix-turn-helix transcriptional regulator [Crenarchaeota archaeon]|nr:winged helix-turn-helix transcriptional regulator [Thermoproteota archaeon]
MATYNRIMSSLKILRELDSILDFSRSSNQLLIIFYMSSVNRETSISELAARLKLSRKSVLDSIRKLERKGLVEKIYRDDDIYLTLSEKGRDYMRKLMAILSTRHEAQLPSTDTALKVMTRINIGHELVTAYRIYRALIALGFSDKIHVSLRDLSRHMGLSMERAKSYLDAFSASPSRLFRRISMPSGVYYRLEKEGKRILYYSPHYMASRKSRIYKFLSKLFKTPWLDEIIGRISLIMIPLISVTSIITGLIGEVVIASLFLGLGSLIYVLIILFLLKIKP